MRVLITNSTDKEHYKKHFKTLRDARKWIINHLNTSKEWDAQDITSTNGNI